MLKWESLNTNTMYTLRAKVPGGWSVAINLNDGAGLTFYPDPQPQWDGSSLS